MNVVDSLKHFSVGVWQPTAQTPVSLLGWLKSFFVTPDSDASHVEAAKNSFERYFLQETSGLANLLGPQGIDNFATDVKAKFQSIVERSFNTLSCRKDGSINGVDFNAAMKQAGKQASMAMERLKVDAARTNLLANLPPVDTRPQIIAHGKQFTVIRPAPQLENLVLRGGGAKGIGYSAALQQMDRSGMLAGVKHLVGSSAGALTATCLATGLSPSQFENGPADALFRPGILDSFKGGSELATLYPDLKLEGGLAPAVASIKLVDQNSATNVQKFLAVHWQDEKFQQQLQGFDPQTRARLEMLRQPAQFDSSRIGKMVTFGDLKALHELAPETFKLLTITGWNKTDQREEYFDADGTPDMPLAYAARISMAFPGAFKSVALESANEGKKVYADGGIGSNMPAEVFTHSKNIDGRSVQLTGESLEEGQARTLLLTFDEGGQAYQIMYGQPPAAQPTGLFGKVKAFFVNLITNHPDQASASLADKIKVWEAGPNALPVFHGNISTLSFNISDARQHEAHMLSAWKAFEQIQVRTQQAYSMEYDSLEQVAQLLTPDEKRALREQPNASDLQRRLVAVLDRPFVHAASAA